MSEKTKAMTRCALVGAMYVVLTLLSNVLGLASGAVQLRVSEALCVLPSFSPATSWGLFVGCIISNLITGCNVFDIIFGSLATLIAGLITAKIKNKYLAPIPTVVANTIVVPLVIILTYTKELSASAYFITLLGVFAGEVLSAYVLGIILYGALKKKSDVLFK